MRSSDDKQPTASQTTSSVSKLSTHKTWSFCSGEKFVLW